MSQTPTDKPKDVRTDTEGRGKVLIDFSKYEESNAKEDSPYPKENPSNWEKNLTVYAITQKDMSLSRWVVRFNSSSNYFENRKQSYTKKVTTKKGETVLGARIHFPKHNSYSHASVSPPYEIMEYNKNGKMVNIGNGVIDNVYKVKEVLVEVSGRNYNNRLFLRVVDQNRKIRDFFMGYLNFVGWRRLVWRNPFYVGNVDQRPLFRPRLYPKENPYYKFSAFIISRPDHGVKGDFVVYFKKVIIHYDLSSVDKDKLSIEDEKTWGIRRRQYMIREAYLKKKNANIRYLRVIELKRMGKYLKEGTETKKEAKTPSDKPK